MNYKWLRRVALAVLMVGFALSGSIEVMAAPIVSRLTPPSELFTTGRAAPVVARFLPGQRFDLQATIHPDAPGKSITQAIFAIDGKAVPLPVTYQHCDSGCTKGLSANTTITTLRAVSEQQPGIHVLTLTARQSDGQTTVATGNFEIIPLQAGGRKIKNIIVLLGDGMGAAQRTAARIVAGGYAQGKVVRPLAMDTFPFTGMVKTASLNSVVTDSAPGMASYVTGNKHNNNELGVFPDDTVDAFDNPRIEYLSEYLHRTQGKALGLVTTADVFDATPAANAVHTSNRHAGTGIVDQFFDDRQLTGLTVLMGGGRQWFLPSTHPGSARDERLGYAFLAHEPHTAEIIRRWGAAPGTRRSTRDLLAEFQAAGFAYAPDKTTLDSIDPSQTERLLGLFALSDMNVALDKVAGRRGNGSGRSSKVVDDYGFPDQPMLDEMTDKALAVLERHQQGFVLVVEGGSIDKQSHTMDTDRWILDAIEFDRTISRVKDFAARRGDTLVIVTADHECGGAALIGASRVTEAKLQVLVREGKGMALRDQVVGVHEQAGFPQYQMAPDGYPVTTHIDHRILVTYGANADRYEDYLTNDGPLQNPQQPFVKTMPQAAYPSTPLARDQEGQLRLTGQVPGSVAVHTATDVPLSAYGPSAWTFSGVQDNTDVFFKLAQAAYGVLKPAGWE